MIGSRYPGQRRSSGFLLVIYLIFGAYFVNYAFPFILIPASVGPFNKWIFFVGGVLIILGAINHFRVGRYKSLYGY